MIKLCNDVNARLDARPPPKPTPGRCTGCRLKFSSEDDEEEEDEDEWGGNYCEEECPDCGYMVCESCSSDKSNGSSIYNHSPRAFSRMSFMILRSQELAIVRTQILVGNTVGWNHAGGIKMVIRGRVMLVIDTLESRVNTLMRYTKQRRERVGIVEK